MRLLVAGLTLALTGVGFAKDPETVKCKDGTTAAGRDACKDNGGVERVPLAKRKQGATAKCGDGTYWHSSLHAGACSHHRGVAEWYGTPLGS